MSFLTRRCTMLFLSLILMPVSNVTTPTRCLEDRTCDRHGSYWNEHGDDDFCACYSTYAVALRVAASASPLLVGRLLDTSYESPSGCTSMMCTNTRSACIYRPSPPPPPPPRPPPPPPPPSYKKCRNGVVLGDAQLHVSNVQHMICRLPADGSGCTVKASASFDSTNNDDYSWRILRTHSQEQCRSLLAKRSGDRMIAQERPLL